MTISLVLLTFIPALLTFSLVLLAFNLILQTSPVDGDIHTGYSECIGPMRRMPHAIVCTTDTAGEILLLLLLDNGTWFLFGPNSTASRTPGDSENCCVRIRVRVRVRESGLCYFHRGTVLNPERKLVNVGIPLRTKRLFSTAHFRLFYWALVGACAL